MTDENILENIVRIGVVSAVDYGSKKARVIFRDKGFTSGWLGVLQHGGAGVCVKENEEPQPDPITGVTPPGASVDKHTHPASVTLWMPAVNDAVVVLYLPVFNGDGFILGAI